MTKAAVTLVAVVVIAAFGGRAAEGQTSHVLDRTYSCRVELGGGLYAVLVSAHAGMRTGKQWAKLPYVGVRTGHATISTGNLLAWATAGRPGAATTMDLDFWSFGGLGTLGVRRTLCRAASGRIPLSWAGLRGGPPAAIGSSYQCEAPRSVLLRIRARLTSPVVPRGREFSSIHVPTRRAQIAVRTTSGRPLAYGEVYESGKARLFISGKCEED